MKKKSLFLNYSAKLALVVLAISGALFAGCSKDDGVDIKGPDVTVPPVVIPPSETTYSVVVSVLDATTLQPVAAKVSDGTVANDKTTSATNAIVTFTYSTAPDKTYTVTPTDADTYKSGSATLKADAIKEGAAVYPITVYLERKGGEDPGPDPEKTEHKYDLTFEARDYETGDKIAEPTITFFKIIEGGTEELALVDYKIDNIEAGAYRIVAEAKGYVKTSVFKVLSSVMGVDPENIETLISISLYKEGEVPPTKDDYTVQGDVLFNGEKLNYTSLVIYNAADKSKTYSNKGTAPGFLVEIPEGDFIPVTRARAAGEYYINILFVVTEGNLTFETTKKFTLVVTAEGTSISEEDLVITGEVKLVAGAPTSNTTLKNITSKSFPIYNETTDIAKTFVEITVVSGKQVTIATTPSSTIIGKLVANALSVYTPQYHTTSPATISGIEIAPYTSIISASYNQVFTTTVTNLVLNTTVGGVTTTTDLTDKVTETVAGSATITQANLGTKKLSHDHLHTHGHGGTNAGGGIIEGE